MTEPQSSEQSKETPETPSLEPLTKLRSDMDRLWSMAHFSRPDWVTLPRFGFMHHTSTDEHVPELDMTENDQSITIAVELPGMDIENVELSYREGMLTVKGEKTFEKKTEKDNVRVMERRYGKFERAVRLPESADGEKIKAHFDKGVLSIEIGKRPEAVQETRKIKIES